MRARDIYSNALAFYSKSYARTSGENRAFQPDTASQVSMEVNMTWKFSHQLIKKSNLLKAMKMDVGDSQSYGILFVTKN